MFMQPLNFVALLISVFCLLTKTIPRELLHFLKVRTFLA